MAEEMVLIPRVRYERLLSSDKDVNPAREGDGSSGKVSEGEGEGEGGQSSPPATVPPSRSDKEVPEEREVEEKKKKIGSDEKEELIKVNVDSILDEIPAEYRVKAERILAYIDIHGGSIINWNSRGRLIYKNMVITGSSMGELLEQLFSNKGKPVVGFSLFKKGLLKINMPNSLLLNNSSGASSGGKKKNKTKKKEEEEEAPNVKVNTLKKKWLKY
jgi:hypothetical protein